MTAELDLRAITLDRDGRRVLDGLDLALAAGERLAIRGANGAGKTTLLRLIVGLERPTSGEVVLAGTPCSSEADFRRARPAIGFLFQDSDDQLFSPTVIEDVAFGPLNLRVPRKEAFARASAQLDAFGLGHLADRPVHRLSGGEKRLVCLAGLFVMRPRVLLLDEPTNALDEEAGARLIDHLNAFPGAMLIATHDPALPARLGAGQRLLRQGRLAGD